MEQESMSAFYGDELQIGGEVEISSEPFSVLSDIETSLTYSAWEPRPGCNPVNEKAVRDLLVWEEKWNKQIMERNKRGDEELRKAPVPELVPWPEPVPWPQPAAAVGKSNMRKRKYSGESSYVAASNLVVWEDKWEQQNHKTYRNLFSLDLPETNDVEMLDSEEKTYPVTAAPIDQSQAQMKKIKKAVPNHWDWMYAK